MSKSIIYGNNARIEVCKGIDVVAEAVRVTMGPQGRNVILERDGVPIVTNDGITVAKDIELENKLYNVGVNIVREAAEKTNKEAGDGTTSTVVLTNAICNEGLMYIRSGVNPFNLTKGLHSITNWVVGELKRLAKDIKNKEEIKQIATISSQDEEVGQMIADVIEEVGHDGTVTVEDGSVIGLSKEIKTGIQIDKGYISPYFVTDQERMETVIEDPYILVIDKKITAFKDLMNILEEIHKQQKGVLLIAEDLDGEALSTIVLNKMRGLLNIVAIRGPGLGDSKKDILKDISIMTGGECISGELGLKLEEVKVGMLGRADKVIVTKDSTTIVGGKGDEKVIEARINEVKKDITKTKSEYEKGKLETRLAKLQGGIAVIKVLCATEMETKNKKYKIEDALQATKAAIEEGIVAGGGSVLIQISDTIKSIGTEEEKIAIDIIKKALEYPAKQIANNGGYKGDWVVENIKETNKGFDAKDGKYKDMIKAGIIDPVKVVRVSLENAVSASSMVLTSECVVLDNKEEIGVEKTR